MGGIVPSLWGSALVAPLSILHPAADGPSNLAPTSCVGGLDAAQAAGVQSLKQ